MPGKAPISVLRIVLSTIVVLSALCSCSSSTYAAPDRIDNHCKWGSPTQTAYSSTLDSMAFTFFKGSEATIEGILSEADQYGGVIWYWDQPVKIDTDPQELVPFSQHLGVPIYGLAITDAPQEYPRGRIVYALVEIHKKGHPAARMWAKYFTAYRAPACL
jgi:hypothetical protein